MTEKEACIQKLQEKINEWINKIDELEAEAERTVSGISGSDIGYRSEIIALRQKQNPLHEEDFSS